MAVSFNSPIFASDEYAYLIRGIYMDNLARLGELDPYIQKNTNFLYFKVIEILENLTGEKFVLVFRILHSVQYVLAGMIIHSIFLPLAGSRNSFLGLLTYLLLPSSIYILAIMPEVELLFLSACLGYVLIRKFPEAPVLASIAAGVLLAVALLIKPHAVALVAGAVLITFAAPLLGLFGKRSFISSASYPSILLTFGYFSFVLLWRVTSGDWVFDPRAPLGLEVYGQYLSEDVPTDYLKKLLSTLHYSFAHLTTIALIFSPVFCWCAYRLWDLALVEKFNNDQLQTGLSMTALFVSIMLAAHVAMVAWFSVGAASINAGEALRVHGRYVGVIFCFLPFLYFSCIQSASKKSIYTFGVVTITAVFVCYFYVFRTFKIYPWDNPILFAFFNSENHYGWQFAGSLPNLGNLVFGAVIVLTLFSLVFERFARSLLTLQLLLVVLAGSYQTYGWLISHNKLNFELTTYSTAVRKIVGKGDMGDGIYVSNERYGRASFGLFSLSNSPAVLIRPEHASIGEGDVLNRKWVVTDREYQTDFRYRSKIVIGPFTVYGLLPNAVRARGGNDTDFELQGKQTVHIGKDNFSASDLTGFNVQEDWGAWTTGGISTMRLPFSFKGKIRVEVFAWTIEELVSQPLEIFVEDIGVSLNLTDGGKSYIFELDIPKTTNTIVIRSVGTQPETSHRVMGSGISWLAIERLE
ncbi:MAG: hypothetical protein ACJAVI_003784 [Candidatus Azotimanducaceae bacterium]|jgi:hypothetical protein